VKTLKPVSRSPWTRVAPRASSSCSAWSGVAHADVEMQLLRIRRVRPARGNPFGHPLKGQLPKAGLQADNHPAVDVFVDPHSQHLAVELRESPRVRAVDHGLFEASDHTHSISARRQRLASSERSLVATAHQERHDSALCMGTAPTAPRRAGHVNVLVSSGVCLTEQHTGLAAVFAEEWIAASPAALLLMIQLSGLIS
jgi:hypothetical protein